MAKYKCMEGKGCMHNNHGWCIVLKKNRLKSITECEHYDDGDNQETFNAENSKVDKDLILEAGRIIGKREMLYYLQKECLAKGEPLTIGDINKFSKMLEFEEKLYNVENYEMIIQKDLRNASKVIAEKNI